MSLVVGYDTFVAIAIESDTTSPYKDGTIGALSTLGETTPDAFLPLVGDEGLESVPNYIDLPMPEGQVFSPSKVQSFGTRAEGGLNVHVPPGMLAAGTFNLKAWCFDRATLMGNANQVKSCTVWVNIKNRCKRFVGVKVGVADFQVDKGQPMVVSLSCVGYGEESVSAPTFTAPSWWHDAVYGADTIGMEIPIGASATNIDSFRFQIDNQLDDDPWRLNTTNYPRRLYNRARSIVGTLDGDYLGDAEYVKFLANTVGSLEANLDKTVGTTQYTATFGFPRIIHNSDAVHGTAQKEQIIKQAIDWRALGGRLGTDSELNAMTWV